MVPLHHASVGGEAKVVSLLLRCGADSNLSDRGGRMPLHWASGHGFVDVVRVLVEEGEAKVEVADKEGWTPLHR